MEPQPNSPKQSYRKLTECNDEECDCDYETCRSTAYINLKGFLCC